ncbi:aminoacyl-tRNA hydrolase [uncultured Duncaniella sp.]|uniref:aminoacyl-tRNA hydrolase n=1 Tax=uncultured Duncaniella sp. TaxID=2768039 RepID=UPI0026762FAB|nr:aminoacyl-tRNA hydrolase [uncultured Duncaniella sp.]MCI9172465.1 aminoacyl-tRNA hydrolase [Muribaculaceae bacterium]
MKYLIVGLGNIGPEYVGTRHNAGFMIADALVEGASATFSTERYGDIARMRVKNAQLVVLKPSTYMNLSGNAVRYWKDKEGIELENILIIVDDCALPFGAIRLKPSGSDAGHNGLKNIAQMLGTQAYARLRFGIGNDFPRGTQIDYVLGHFTPDQLKAMKEERIPIAVDAIKTFCLAGMQRAMCDYNNK